MRPALLACAFAFSLIATALADGNTGLIYGRVFADGTRTPPCGRVAVTASSDREAPQVTYTSADGSFHFLSVIPGRVTLTVGAVARDVNVSANIPNMDTYVRPIYISARRSAFIVRSSTSNFMWHSCP
jgi:hypothetical protein